jgi:hypothetical protein
LANKLTRKEIVQEDVIRKTLTETSSWAVEHLKLIAGAVVLVVVGSLAVWGWQTWSASRSAAMQQALADAMAIYHGEIRAADAGPDTRSAFEKPKYSFASEQERNEKALNAFRTVAEEYDGSLVGDVARYYVGVISYETGKQEEAQAAMRAVIASADTPDLRNLARHALAQYLQAAGQTQEAMELLNRILEEPSPNFPAQAALMALAKAQEASGDLAGALERYRKVAAEHAGTPLASEANERIRRLELVTQQAENSTPATDAQPAPANP